MSLNSKIAKNVIAIALGGIFAANAWAGDDAPVPAFLQTPDVVGKPAAKASANPPAPSNAPVQAKAAVPKTTLKPASQSQMPESKSATTPVAPIPVSQPHPSLPKHPVAAIAKSPLKPVPPAAPGHPQGGSMPIYQMMPMPQVMAQEPGNEKPDDFAAFTKSEKKMVHQRALLLQNAELWDARAKNAVAQAKYMDAVLKIQKATTGLNSAAMAAMPQPPAPQPDDSTGKVIDMAKTFGPQQSTGITPVAVMGLGKHMTADVIYNGGRYHVRKGDHVGDWKIVAIRATTLIAYKNGKRHEIPLMKPGLN